jgi:hypothetical protein
VRSAMSESGMAKRCVASSMALSFFLMLGGFCSSLSLFQGCLDKWNERKAGLGIDFVSCLTQRIERRNRARALTWMSFEIIELYKGKANRE